MKNKNFDLEIASLEKKIVDLKKIEELILSLNLFTTQFDPLLPSKIKNKVLSYQKKYNSKENNENAIIEVKDKAKEKFAFFKNLFKKKYKQDIEEEFNEYKNKILYKYKKNAANYKNEIHRLENMKKWQALSEDEKNKSETDLTFYKANVSGYWLNISIILFEVIYLIVMLSFMEKNYWIGIFILTNIFFLLFLFTSSIKIKNYIKKFSYFLIIFGVYMLIRLFVVIPIFMNIPLFTTLSTTNKIWIFITGFYSLFMSLLIGFTSLKKIRRKEKYLNEGNISFKQMSK